MKTVTLHFSQKLIPNIYDLESMTTCADDNYLGSENKSLVVALAEPKAKIERGTKWIMQSGLKLNEKKTDKCII